MKFSFKSINNIRIVSHCFISGFLRPVHRRGPITWWRETTSQLHKSGASRRLVTALFFVLFFGFATSFRPRPAPPFPSASAAADAWPGCSMSVGFARRGGVPSTPLRAGVSWDPPPGTKHFLPCGTSCRKLPIFCTVFFCQKNLKKKFGHLLRPQRFLPTCHAAVPPSRKRGGPHPPTEGAKVVRNHPPPPPADSIPCTLAVGCCGPHRRPARHRPHLRPPAAGPWSLHSTARRPHLPQRHGVAAVPAVQRVPLPRPATAVAPLPKGLSLPHQQLMAK